MSKQEEIYSMFGIKSPQQIRDERRAEQMAYFRSLQTPESRAGAGIGMALASLFGKPSAEEQEAMEAEALMADAMQAEGGQIAKMAALANRFNEANMPKAAMAALAELDRLKKAEMDRRDEQELRLAQLDKANIVMQPVVVGTKDIYGPADAFGNRPIIGQEDVIKQVPHDRRTGQPIIPLDAMGGSSGSVEVKLDNPINYTKVGQTRDGFPTATTNGKYYILNDDGTLGEEIPMSEIIINKEEVKAKPKDSPAPAPSAYEQGLIDMYGTATPAPAINPVPLSVPELTEEDKKSLGGYANYLNY